MAVHDDRSVVLLIRQERLPHGHQVIAHLFGQRHAWADTRMHEKIVALAIRQHQATQPGDM